MPTRERRKRAKARAARGCRVASPAVSPIPHRFLAAPLEEQDDAEGARW